MSVSASTWVPLATAGAGLIAGLATGLGGAVLTRRWASEDRRAAWQREDRLRWQADRLQAYARLISALDAWHAELSRARVRQEDGEPFDAAEWERHFMAVSELVMLVSLTAPEQVRNLAGLCLVEYTQSGEMLTAGEADAAAIQAGADRVELATHSLMEAMRADLSLGGGGRPVAGAAPRPDGRS